MTLESARLCLPHSNEALASLVSLKKFNFFSKSCKLSSRRAECSAGLFLDCAGKDSSLGFFQKLSHSALAYTCTALLGLYVPH